MFPWEFHNNTNIWFYIDKRVVDNGNTGRITDPTGYMMCCAILKKIKNVDELLDVNPSFTDVLN